MCAITERNSLICGHTHTSTERCSRELFREWHQARHKSQQNVVKRFLSQFRAARAEDSEGALCKPTLDSHTYYEICHSCRRTWLSHGYTEQEAVEKYHAFRKKHDYLGELTAVDEPDHPTLLTKAQLSERIKRKRANPEASSKRKEKQARPVSPASVETHTTGRTTWPSFVKKAPKEHPVEQEPIPDPEEMELDEIYRSLPDEENLPADTFDIGEESLNPQIRDYPPKKTIDRHRFDFNSSFESIDLNKPLPPPPRVGSPMPGRPFDRENPDRDLPRNKYYPRFF